MVDRTVFILSLLIVWFIGYEIGKYMMAQKIRDSIGNLAKELKNASEKLKEEEKEQ